MLRLKWIEPGQVREGDTIWRYGRQAKVVEREVPARRIKAEWMHPDVGESPGVWITYEMGKVQVDLDMADPRLGSLEEVTEEVAYHLTSSTRMTAALLEDLDAEQTARNLSGSIGDALYRDLKEFHPRMLQAIKAKGYGQAEVKIFVRLVK